MPCRLPVGVRLLVLKSACASSHSALEAVQQGLQHHPLDSMLISEHATLDALLNLNALRSAA
jgi:hypothetical protein